MPTAAPTLTDIPTVDEVEALVKTWLAQSRDAIDQQIHQHTCPLGRHINGADLPVAKG